jgi:predicted aldo/keto reductase-like oxidoreductase
MNEIDRRKFLRTSLFGGASAFLASISIANSSVNNTSDEAKEKPILKRKLGKTGIELPIVSFGVMRSDNQGLISAAIKEGITLFDTAHTYQGGKNEEMLGEVLQNYPRDSYLLATKILPDDYDMKKNIIGPGVTSKGFLEKLEIGLKRLKTSYVDILYIHAMASRDNTLHPVLLEAMTEVKKSGKARHVGVSTHRNEPEVIQAAIDSGVYEVVLTSINFKQGHYTEVKRAIEAASKAGLGIVAMKTMAGGFHDKERKQPINCKAALKFVMQNENIATAIPGITNFDQLAINASVNHDLTLTTEEQADLTVGKSQGGLYCQGCKRCVPSCLKGLPIPDIMRAYMYAYGYSNSRQAQELLTSIGLTGNPCGDCTHCSAVCTKNFAISERVTDVMRLTTVPEEFLS